MASIVKADYRADMKLPDGSAAGQDQLEAANPNRAGFNAQIVLRRRGVENLRSSARWKTCSRRSAKLDGIDVTSPYSPGVRPGQQTAPVAFAGTKCATASTEAARPR